MQVGVQTAIELNHCFHNSNCVNPACHTLRMAWNKKSWSVGVTERMKKDYKNWTCMIANVMMSKITVRQSHDPSKIPPLSVNRPRLVFGEEMWKQALRTEL